MVTASTRRAYSEVDTFLELLSKEDRNKIPEKVRDIFKRNKDPNYQKIIDTEKRISDQNLMMETLEIIAFLNLRFWCDDEKEREKLMNIYRNNDKKRSEEMYDKLNHLNDSNEKDSILNTESNNQNELTLNEKSSFWKKMIDSIIHLFKKK